MKENRIPNKINKDMLNSNPFSSTTPGSKWIKTSPSKAPAEKLTKYIKNLLSVEDLKDKVKKKLLKELGEEGES